MKMLCDKIWPRRYLTKKISDQEDVTKQTMSSSKNRKLLYLLQKFTPPPPHTPPHRHTVTHTLKRLKHKTNHHIQNTERHKWSTTPKRTEHSLAFSTQSLHWHKPACRWQSEESTPGAVEWQSARIGSASGHQMWTPTASDPQWWSVCVEDTYRLRLHRSTSLQSYCRAIQLQ